MTPQEEHASLLKSGMFWEFFPELTGNWEDDSDYFTEFVTKRNSK